MDNKRSCTFREDSSISDVTSLESLDPEQKIYRTYGNIIHCVTATYIIVCFQAIIYSVLFYYQLSVAKNIGTEVFGAVIYVPCILTVVFMVTSIAVTVAAFVAISKSKRDLLDYSSYYIYASMIYLIYLCLITMLSVLMDYEWLNFMRVQVENKPRFVTGMPEEYLTWEDFRKDSMEGRSVFLGFTLLCVIVVEYIAIPAIATCGIFLCDQAEIASKEKVSECLISHESDAQAELSSVVETECSE